MNRLKRLTGKKMLLTAMALCAFGFAKAQTEQTAQNTLTLTLDKVRGSIQNVAWTKCRTKYVKPPVHR